MRGGGGRGRAPPSFRHAAYKQSPKLRFMGLGRGLPSRRKALKQGVMLGLFGMQANIMSLRRRRRGRVAVSLCSGLPPIFRAVCACGDETGCNFRGLYDETLVMAAYRGGGEGVQMGRLLSSNF